MSLKKKTGHNKKNMNKHIRNQTNENIKQGKRKHKMVYRKRSDKKERVKKK